MTPQTGSHLHMARRDLPPLHNNCPVIIAQWGFCGMLNETAQLNCQFLGKPAWKSNVKFGEFDCYDLLFQHADGKRHAPSLTLSFAMIW